MIKDVMVRLEGTAADDLRLAAVNSIADMFDSRVIGLYFNVLPVLITEEGDTVGTIRAAELLRRAQETGDVVEKELHHRLTRLQKPVEIRRFNVLADAVADIAAREARTADTFVGLRPNGEGTPQEPEHLVEGVMFGSGRHLVLVPPGRKLNGRVQHVLVAWNGSRESARALAESLPYCYKAKPSPSPWSSMRKRPNWRRGSALMPPIISTITASMPHCIASGETNARLERR